MVVDRRVELRRAEIRDVQGIRSLDRKVYPTPWSEKLLVREISKPGRVHLVAEQRFALIGHGGIVVLDDEAHVTTIAVEPARQGQGIGSGLLLGLFRAAATLGCRLVTLEVRAGNTAAIALYRRFGLAPVGVRRGYYSDTNEDALVLVSPDLAGDYLDRIDAMAYPTATTLSPELQSWQNSVGVETVAEAELRSSSQVGERTA